MLVECRDAGGGEVLLQQYSNQAIQAWVQKAGPRDLASSIAMLLEVLQVFCRAVQCLLVVASAALMRNLLAFLACQHSAL